LAKVEGRDSKMTDGNWITIISLGVTFLFMLGVPVFL